jgi:predicted tellurium resistance membrane protein TerC
MTDLVASDAVMALIQVVMINLVLSGDNAVVIGLAAAGLPAEQRKRAITIGILIATALRIACASIATQRNQPRCLQMTSAEWRDAITSGDIELGH